MEKNDRTETLEKSIEELRRGYDECCSNYEHARTKGITFLGGGLGVLGYLYGGGALFFPKELYGQIFYCLGLISYLIALYFLFSVIQPVLWRTPAELKIHRKLKFDDYVEFLEYTKDEYLEALGINFSHNRHKQRCLNNGFFMLLVGVILLIVIKFFNQKGGAI